MDQQQWQRGEVLAWTEADGPGRPPAAPARWITGSVAASLTLTLTGILATDALCPDHRAWVQGLASVAVFSAVVAIVQVVRGESSGALFALLSATLGVVIGLIDAVHAPGRGMLIALGFGIAGVGGAAVAFRMEQMARWGRGLSTSHVALAELEQVEVGAGPVAAEAVEVVEAAEAVDDVEQPAR